MDAHTAQILIQAKNIFKAAGYRVKIWDAYRPIRAQRRFWEILPDDNFVARPPEVAKIKTFRPSHMNGMCVDVTLTNLDGTDIEMPSPFDTMNERAALSCKRNSAVGRKNASYLKEVMERVKARFTPEETRQLDRMLRIVGQELMPEVLLKQGPAEP